MKEEALLQLHLHRPGARDIDYRHTGPPNPLRTTAAVATAEGQVAPLCTIMGTCLEGIIRIESDRLAGPLTRRSLRA